MGTPKALLQFDGLPLISHITGELQRMFAAVIVVAAPGQDFPSLPATVVRDDVAYQGPVGGIVYGLRVAETDACFVTSCDSAFLNPVLISHLVSRLAGHDVVVPHWDGRLQPLHAVYRRCVLPLLEAQLERGELRPVQLFDRVRTCRIDEEEVRRFDPEGTGFFNMNTPGDYVEAQRRWSAGNPLHCTVELLGVARLLAGASEVWLALPRGATLAGAFAALAEQLPALTGRVVSADGQRLAEGYACNVNGLDFVRTPTAAVHPGDRILILPADRLGIHAQK